MIQDNAKYLTREQLAAKLQVNVCTISKWMRTRGLPFRKFGTHRCAAVRFHEPSVDEWFTQQQKKLADTA